MKAHFLLAAPALVALLAACTADTSRTKSEATDNTVQATSTYKNHSPCPTGANIATQQAAASAAYQIMTAAAVACKGNEGGTIGGPCWGDAILNSVRYSVAKGGATIEFNPTDSLYRYVPRAAQAALALIQQNSTVAAFLVQGLEWAQKNTDGTVSMVSIPLEALASFKYPGNQTPIAVQDGNAGGTRRTEVVVGSEWCGATDIHFIDTSTDENGFSPFNLIPTTTMSEPSGRFPGFTGSHAWPSTPFNGPGGGSNPYLVVSVWENNVQQPVNWNSTSFPTENCGNSPACQGTINIDPVPYSMPGTQYDVSGSVLGPQSNPYNLNVVDELADSSHQGEYAQHTVNGVVKIGTFSRPISVLGTTVYGYAGQ
jgi:hypothetical protein